MDRPACALCLCELLVHKIAPGTVVILPSHRTPAQYDCWAMDNLTTHRNKEAAEDLRDQGCRALYLPPYAPDLNPIALAFTKLKAHLRQVGARTCTDCPKPLDKFVTSTTQQSAGTALWPSDVSQVKTETLQDIVDRKCSETAKRGRVLAISKVKASDQIPEAWCIG